MRTFFDRLPARASGAFFLLLLLLLSFFLGGVGCRLERLRGRDEESVLSPITESEMIHAFLWDYETR